MELDIATEGRWVVAAAGNRDFVIERCWFGDTDAYIIAEVELEKLM